MVKKKHITKLPILGECGYVPKESAIIHVKKHQYFIETNYEITGDAPKDFIRYYNFGSGRCRKGKTSSWPLYIAKLGHKHYPIESITEYLLNRIGEVCGLEMAESKLVCIGGQIRFLSKYFLNKRNEQTLDHGANLYAGYLNDDSFVEQIEEQDLSPDFFTVDFTKSALEYHFKEDYNNLMAKFIDLIVFDAFIGNNDRHYYNWAIIRHLLKKQKPLFSPIYDTAKGLFWNWDEKRIVQCFANKERRSASIKKYSEDCKPKIGWENSTRLNHFKMIERLNAYGVLNECNILKNILIDKTLNQVYNLVDIEFKDIMSFERREMIKYCLEYRRNKIKGIINDCKN
jgi:hypothetical protein